MEVNDGSCLQNIQVIADNTLENYPEVRKLTTGSAVAVTGALVASPGKGQAWEVHASPWRSSDWHRKIIPCRRSGTVMSS